MMGCKVLYLGVSLLCLVFENVGANCPQPSFPSNNVVLSDSPTQSFPDGSTATFQCMIGHIPVNSRAPKTVTCNGNTWTKLELNCTRKSCGSPPDFSNGRYEKTGILFGDAITAVCNTGYTLAGYGSQIRVCRDQGWDGRDPICEVVKCDPPPGIINGQLEDEPLESYDYLQVVTYTCNSGLSLIGSTTLYCSEDGTFKPDPPSCSDGCPKPEIQNAIRIGGKAPPYKMGNFIDYKCEDGYTMRGDSHIVCRANGWSPEPPQCIGPCPYPNFGGNVVLTDDSKNTFPNGSIVTFQCRPGYEPVDSTVSKSVTCSETKWTKLLLTCKAKPTTVPTTTTTTIAKTTITTKLLTIRPTLKETKPGSAPLSGLAIFGIVFGALVVVVALGSAGGVWYMKSRSKRQYSDKVATSNEDL